MEKSKNKLKREIRAMSKFLRKHKRGVGSSGEFGTGNWFGPYFISNDGELVGRSIKGDVGWRDADDRQLRAASETLREDCHLVYRRVSVDAAIDALIEAEEE